MQRLLVALAVLGLSCTAFGQDRDIERIDVDFNDLDNNEDLYLSRDEVDDSSVADHFSRIDGNADGQISQPEFRDYVTSNPGAVNEDAVLDDREPVAPEVREP